MKERYIFFRGLIDTLDLYTYEFVKICTAQGAECLVLDASHIEQEMLRLKAFLLSPVTAVISMNNVGLHLELENGENIWDSFRISFFNIMMDHPFHYKEALESAPAQMILLCMDKNHVEYVKRFYTSISDVRFFPHGGIETGPDYSQWQHFCSDNRRITNIGPGSKEGNTGCVTRIPISERRIDVLYAGGLSRYAAEGLIPDLGNMTEFDAFVLVKHALERLIEEPHLTTEYVIEQCLQEMDVMFDDKKLGEVITRLRFLDNFAVSFYREQMIRVLVEHGITVAVFGQGWERVEWGNENFIYGGEIPPFQILELMKQSKIVLNSMTWFKRGAHDRIFNGMLAGAAVVSDSSAYMQEQFTNGRELQMFSLREWNHLTEIVGGLLERPQKAQEMADCGYVCAKMYHMWSNRLKGAGVNGFS